MSISPAFDVLRLIPGYNPADGSGAVDDCEGGRRAATKGVDHDGGQESDDGDGDGGGEFRRHVVGVVITFIGIYT